MIYEPDKLRGYLMRRMPMGRAFGRAGKYDKAILEAWAETGRPIVIIWGPPGSGKSTILASFDKPNCLVFETTGLNNNINATIRRLCRGGFRHLFSFIVLLPSYSLCKSRVSHRPEHPIQKNEDLAPLIQMWFDRANARLDYSLPVDILIQIDK